MKIFLFIAAIIFANVASAGDPTRPHLITLAEHGVGPINKDTPFDRKAVQRLLPNLKVEKAVSSTEDEDFPVLLISDSQGLLFTINPSAENKILSVVLENDRITNELGHRTGQSYKQVFQDIRGNCFAGNEEYSGTVLCDAPNSKHVKYLFEGEWDGPDGQVPPQNVLSRWTITSVIWKP